MSLWRIASMATLGLACLARIGRSQTPPEVGGVDASPGIKGTTSIAIPVHPNTYGTSDVTRYNVDAFELIPINSGNHYNGINNYQLRYLTNFPGLGLAATMHLPSGAIVTRMELDYYDSSAAGQVIAVFGVCDYVGINCDFPFGSCPQTANTICSSVAGAPGYAFVQSDLSPIVIDNFNHRYIIVAGNTTLDGSTAISKIIIGYNLQVSPPPSVAGFGDVPTNHPFFQFIEALRASGITAGCNSPGAPPLYCPNAPVTRGQMAVFLAKALGLHFPN